MPRAMPLLSRLRPLMLFVIIIMSMAGRVEAASEPVIAAAPTWVRSADIPKPTHNDQVPVRMLMFDEQVSLQPGQLTAYRHVVLHMQTPQGLAAGNISIAWRSQTDTLTIHHLLIRRGDTIIDTVAAGQEFTIARREQNLEAAILDGVLTASILPEGLQVGDMLDLAYSITSHDPVLKDHVEFAGPSWIQSNVDNATLRVQWPGGRAVKIRTIGDLAPVKPTRQAGMTSVEITRTNIEPIKTPKGAPARFNVGRMVEFSDFSEWGDLSALMFPHYQKAAKVPSQGPLREELDRIRSSTTDKVGQAEAVLALVQNDVRYFALAMGAGALVPADAEITWTRRYGDCKAKTALLLALLRELGITADAVLVNSDGADGLNERLPMIGLFDHVLVRARIGDKEYWLDGTRVGDTSLARVPVPALHWGLVLAAKGGALVPMMPAPLDAPTTITNIHMDATAGLKIPAPTQVETIMTGDGAMGTKLSLDGVSKGDRDQILRQYWRNEYDFIDIETVTSDFDATTGELRLKMTGKARMDWSNNRYITDDTGVGYNASFTRDPGPDHEAPYGVPFPHFTKVTQTILLPRNAGNFTLSDGVDVDRILAGIEYKRRGEIRKDVVTIEKTERSLVTEVPYKSALADQDGLKTLSKQRAIVRKPKRYRPTDAEVDLAMSETPVNSAAYLERAQMLLDRGRYKEAISDFDQVIKQDPKNTRALLGRANARTRSDDHDGAAKDIIAAEAIEPESVSVSWARVELAQTAGRPLDAIAAYSRILELKPDDKGARLLRVRNYIVVSDYDKALADATKGIDNNPENLELYEMRALIHYIQGQTDLAVANAEAALRAKPDDVEATLLSARIYKLLARDADVMRLYEQALSRKPDTALYLSRSLHRPITDWAARLSDIDAALTLEPNNLEAGLMKFEVLMEMDNPGGAADAMTSLLDLTGNDSALMTQRGVAHLKAGNADLAEQDFTMALTLADEALAQNNKCWFKATNGVALESALADCDKALALRPDAPAYLDSRGLANLRLGRLDAAIADYDRALVKNSSSYHSLYGRGLAWARKGDTEKATADFLAAIKLEPSVATEFARYGVTP